MKVNRLVFFFNNILNIYNISIKKKSNKKRGKIYYFANFAIKYFAR